MDATELINKSCRICLNDITSGVLIFSEEGKRQYLQAKIRRYLYITVSSLDMPVNKLLCCFYLIFRYLSKTNFQKLYVMDVVKN